MREMIILYYEGLPGHGRKAEGIFGIMDTPVAYSTGVSMMPKIPSAAGMARKPWW